MISVTLKNLKKYFGEVKAVDNLNLQIGEGEFMALLGPSGCGKTTTLLTIAGFYKPTAGEVYFNDRMVNDIPPRSRNIGMVFQSYALYPHMNVLDNIAFPLKLKKQPKKVWREKAVEVAKLLQIDDLLDRMPAQLSGGQQQRVALARALIKQPQLLLLDEPLSNLDAKLRIVMRAELKRLQKDLGITTIFVTHDQMEAMTMADRIAVLKSGKLQQVGTPDELYDEPANVFVASFIGTPPMNFIRGSLLKSGSSYVFECEHFRILLDEVVVRKIRRFPVTNNVILGIRPEDVEMGMGEIKGEIYVVEPMGRDTLVTVKFGDVYIKVLTSSTVKYSIGESVSLSFKSDKVQLFDGETEESLYVKGRDEG